MSGALRTAVWNSWAGFQGGGQGIRARMPHIWMPFFPIRKTERGRRTGTAGITGMRRKTAFHMTALQLCSATNWNTGTRRSLRWPLPIRVKERLQLYTIWRLPCRKQAAGFCFWIMISGMGLSISMPKGIRGTTGTQESQGTVI